MKTILTKTMIEEISKRIKAGCYVKATVGSLGIEERTYYRWIERGQMALKLKAIGQKVKESEEIYCQLCQSIRTSENESEVLLTTMIFSQAQQDWKAALEILARKYPERWGRKDHLDFKGSMDLGPDKHEEALNEFEKAFEGVPRGKLSEILFETTQKIREAKNGNGSGNKDKNK